MTTPLDTELIPEWVALIEEVGVQATYREENYTPDTDASTVTLGAPTDYTITVSPPQMEVIEVETGLSAVRMETQRVYLASGAGTADAIGFEPKLSSEDTISSVILNGLTHRIVKIKRLRQGDEVGVYVLNLMEG